MFADSPYRAISNRIRYYGLQIAFTEPLQIEGIVSQGDPDNVDNFANAYSVQYKHPDTDAWLDVLDEEGNTAVSINRVIT